MNKTIYRQYDSRWGSKPYPTKSSTFSGNGCGCVACTHILIELEKYKSTTPEPVRQYMVGQGFAVAHQGTTWSGIPKTLNHYGFNAKEHATMPEIFSVLDKRKKAGKPCLGVILFSAGTRGGVTWTSGGHYVAFVDYKVENGKHYFYTKDSGTRHNDGWHAYETTMRGLIPKIWSAEAPANTPAKKKTVDELAKEVIDGKWGNGDARKQALVKAGYDYNAVQAKVNELLKKKDNKQHLVIDVSAYQDSINWSKVKADGVQGVIVKCGYRGYETGKLNTDGMFLNHIKGAYKAGLKVGIYFFTEAINAKEGKAEADYTIKLMQTAGVPLSYPIAIDTEAINAKTERAKGLSKAQRTVVIKAFCDQIKVKGYEPMIYASLSWLNNQLDMSKLPYNVWVAQYNSTCDYKGKYVMWQYSSSGKVNGVKGNVDMNKCYIEPKAVNPPSETKKNYAGTYPSIKLVKSNAQVKADACKFAKWIADGIDFHYGCNDHAFHNGCYFCGTNDKFKKGHGMKMWETTYCCNPFVGACWAHGGGDTTAYKMCHNCNSWGFKTSEGYEKSSLFNKLGHPAKSKLQAGDVLCNWTHVALYIGDGKIAEASGLDDNVYGSKKWKNSIAVKTLTDAKYNTFERCYRYNGNVDVERVLSNGEVSDRVADLQRYLIWYGATDVKVNSIFDARTLKAVIAFQEQEMGKGQGDGLVGAKTIEAMKKVKK